MYALVSAIGEPLGGGRRWEAVSIGDMPLAQIYRTYARVLVTLSNNFIDHPVSLDLADVQSQYGALTTTFNQLLAQLGNNALPTSNTIPAINTRYAKYADPFRAGYKAQPIHPTWAPDAQVPPAEKTWLMLTRPATDYALFKSSCMVSVNGMWHPVDADSRGIYITEGDKSRQVSGRNNLGIYSFRELGALTYVPITPQMVYKQLPTQGLRNRAYINVGQSMANKTVLLVLGGYLHLLDSRVFRRTSDQCLLINMENLPLVERYHESKHLLDLSSLPLQRTTANPDQIGINDFFSDAVLTAYLSLPQSFIVLLDNPDVFAERVAIHSTKNPGSFIAPGAIQPQFPLISGYGQSPNYWSTYEDGQWSITTVSNQLDNPLHHTVDLMQQQGVSDQRVPGLRYRFSDACFLKVGRDI